MVAWKDVEDAALDGPSHEGIREQAPEGGGGVEEEAWRFPSWALGFKVSQRRPIF